MSAVTAKVCANAGPTPSYGGHVSVEKYMPIPVQVVILLSGIPATGKSEFARYLAREHRFAHYDLECYPRGWANPELKQTWDTDRNAFVSQLRKHHDRVALDWGFPPRCLQFVLELQKSGVKLVWFDGDIAHARELFVQRGGIAVGMFDHQVADIRSANFPASLNCVVISRLSSAGVFLDDPEVENMIFG
jgi:hypothetical protein